MMAVRVIRPSIKTGSNTKEPIQIPDTSVKGIENYQKIGSGVCYDTGTSDTAGTWTVSIPNITALTEGLTIKVRLKTSYNSTKNTLNVNGLGAKTVYFRYGSKLTSHYAKESVLALTYTANAIGSGTDTSGWIVENIYDSTNTYQLRVNNTRPKTKSALYRYMICFVNNDGLLIPANDVNNSTATTKTLTTESFNLFDSIYYYNSTKTISANGQVGTGTLYKQLSIDLRYSFNTGTTLVEPNGVYLKVTADGSQFKLATNNPITQSLPTSDDGYFYCYLGRAYSATNIELVPEHPIYLYKNGIIQEYSAYAKSVAEKAVKKSGDTMIGSLTIQQGNSINVSQYNDAGGTSLMNNGDGLATQFGSSTRPSRMFSSVQPEWYKNGESQGVLALKSDIPTNYVPNTRKVNSKALSSDITLGASDVGALPTAGGTVTGDLTVGGNLTINGTTTTVDSTTLQVKDKLIEVAHGNTAALTTPAGLVAPKYDGTNSGALVFDSTGTAYVGDVTLKDGNIDVANSGGLQPIATRTGLVGGNLVQYDSSAETLKDSGKKISDLATTSQVNAKYTKPSGGIPKTDLASDVKTSLEKADNALSLDGGTIKKSKTIKMDASANSDGANLKWGTVNSKNPYIGYASDQVDGTFVIGSLLGTNYASGLAIGGGSGNLLWKGTKVTTTNDIPDVSVKANLSGGNTFTGQQIFQNANSGAVSECIVNDTAWDSFTVRSVSDNTQKTAISNGYVWCQDSDAIYSQFKATGIYYGNDTSGYEGTLKFPTNISGEKIIATTDKIPTFSLSETTLTITLP